MLTILGQPHRFCDGVSRRNFLKIGGLALGGMSFPELLRAESTSSMGRSHKSIIMIYLPGGPPHQDMYEIKTEAPSEIRGEFKPIATRVPGIQISEGLPLMANMMDKLVAIRSVVGAKDRHASFQCMTGWLSDNQPQGEWPEMGSVLSKLYGPTHSAIPPYINLSPRMKHFPYNAGKPGFLGMSHAAFKPNDECKSDMILNGITLERLSDRKNLLGSLDEFRRKVDRGAAQGGLDPFTEQALAFFHPEGLPMH